ncbi:MAG TPA: LD-carboxypeptidase [Gemmatimonadaceae bacterium]|nr:LD-carboxypeptidase [Gemmatimonadaceae bacterium]
MKPLGEGSRVALVAPSGPLPNKAQVKHAEANAKSLGWIPVVGSNINATHGYLAGTDEERLADLNAAINDEAIDGIWCVRGGYGAMRLLAKIDYARLRDRPRALIGFSDITALHAAIHRECGINSFHGPTARGELTDFSRQSLKAAVTNQEDSCGTAPDGRVIREGKAHGRLAGGNLALVTALQGTPYSVDFDGAILVIEDIGEPVYRIDRMLRQLLLGEALHQCAGLVAGDFRPPVGDKTFDSRAVDDLLAETADIAGIPCLAGAPFGHIADQWTIPIGAMAELDTSRLSLRVTGA